MSKQNDNIGMIGIVKIEEIDRDTGNVISEFEQRNTITAEGFNAILQQMTGKGDGMSTDAMVKTIALGDDTGSGTATSPEPPSILSTYLDQTTVYMIPESDIVIGYPTIGEFSLSSLIVGEEIVDSMGIEAINYTSATIRLNNNETLSYKRFPIKTISRLINIRITWNIKFS